MHERRPVDGLLNRPPGRGHHVREPVRPDPATIPPGRSLQMSVRPIKEVIHTQPHVEGAGAKLQRAFGFGNTTEFDPFLLFDDFRNDDPKDYAAGFPWHPHRGIETITYVLAGNVEHGDSLGNRGSLGAG